ncbi:MAG: SMP-30/gluconolactonase/LRE family protein, partial [Bdellovibrionota bacterium]
NGFLYGGTEDGKILKITKSESEEKIEEFAATGGRPLGLDFDSSGNLWIADARKGLLRVTPSGKVEVMTSTAEGGDFGFTDDVEAASDGMVYFSDASTKWGLKDYLFDALEARPYGRLLAYDPAKNETRVLLKDLYFANGIALSQAEDFVLVNETYRYRITRYWLKSPKAGEHDVFIDNLPGFPDGVSSDGKGTFWVAMFTVRNKLADAIHPHPFIKKIAASLPKFLQPKPEPYGLALAIDENGKILESLHDPGGKIFPEVTSAEPYGDFLYLGTLHRYGICRYRLPQSSQP